MLTSIILIRISMIILSLTETYRFFFCSAEGKSALSVRKEQCLRVILVLTGIFIFKATYLF